MQKQQMVEYIKKTIDLIKEYDYNWEQYGRKILDINSDFVLCHHKISEQMIDYCEIIIGDKFKWLNWFIFDNDFGKEKLEAKASSWKKSRKIQTIKDLVDIIWADLEDHEKK